MTRLHAAVGVLSAAVIAFELVLMQLLSIVQWHHFAYMVISVALLGFGASGTLIAIARKWLLDRFDVLVPLLAMASGASMAVLIGVSQSLVARFDSYLLFVDASQGWSLLVSYLIFFIPFFLAALAIGLVLVDRVTEIGRYYFANMVGSGLGALIAINLLWNVAPERLPAATGLIAILAGFLIVPSRSRRTIIVLG
ncbi:MAG: spermidine synthase-like protein, partial [Bacteroidetes bacterium]|nr:spermidine synthase-like protein [Bacteroidota bacterium]